MVVQQTSANFAPERKKKLQYILKKTHGREFLFTPLWENLKNLAVIFGIFLPPAEWRLQMKKNSRFSQAVECEFKTVHLIIITDQIKSNTCTV